MHVLFVHNNYPAQFRYIAPRLVRDFGWRCTFATHNARKNDLPGVERVIYRLRSGATPANHACTRAFENEVGHAYGVYETLKHRPDIQPDLVVAHSGFGSSLFLPHLYDAPIVNFFEYFRRPVGGCIGYRPEVPLEEADVLRYTSSNSMILQDLHHCDRGWCPNFAQRDEMPTEYHPRIEVIPEGVDTELYQRRCGCESEGERKLPNGTVISPGTRIVTYVSRGFELARGFDVFMAAAKRICEARSDVVFVVAGTDRSYYMADGKVTGGQCLRRRVLDAGHFDLSRFHFLGWLPEEKLVDVLSLSDLHVYLTVPFITSWSMLDAMSCSCVVLASDQACTREYITHGVNGLLCDFFDAEGIAEQAVEVLKDPAAYRHLGEAARLTIEQKYSLDVCLPRITAFFEETVANGPRTPSVVAEKLVRPAMPAWWNGSTRDARAQAAAEPVAVLAPFAGAIPFPGRSEESGESPDSRTNDEEFFDSLGTTEVSGPRSLVGRKTVLFCWELGAGLGHLMQMMPLATDLAAAGHCVVMALRHLERAVNVFGRAGVFFLPAPHAAPSPAPPRFRQAAAFGQFLANLGFGDDDALFGLASAWRNLIRSVGPDLIVGDHSPTALLAARAFPGAKRAVIGSGFCVPPLIVATENETAAAPAPRPWGLLRPRVAAADPAPALAVEAEVLSRVNWMLGEWGQPPMQGLGQLYSDVDETFLTTFPELDHFGVRDAAGYWGPVLSSTDGGEAPEWPGASGRKVFVYLKPSPAAGDVLAALKRLKCPTLAYLDGATPAVRKRLESPTLHVADRRVDVAAASRECDLAVLNGGHGVTAEMLLAGKPVLAVPLVLEQQMTGDALKRMGAGESAPPRRGEPWEWAGRAKLEAMLSDDCYARAAHRFADRYAAFDPAQQRAAMFRRVEELLADEPLPGDPLAVTREAELAAV